MSGGDRPTKGRRSKFAMVPHDLICGRLATSSNSQAHAMNLWLYAYLAMRQGESGRAVRGFRKVGKDMGLQPRTVRDIARRLAEDGWIELRNSEGRAAHEQAEMNVLHNPATLSRRNPEARRVGPPKRHGHEPKPAPEARRSAEGVQPCREACAFDAPTPGALSAQSIVRAAHDEERAALSGGPDAAASYAVGPRSPRSERVGVTESDWTVCSTCGDSWPCECPFDEVERTPVITRARFDDDRLAIGHDDRWDMELSSLIEDLQ
jgi:hypothetical protein